MRRAWDDPGVGVKIMVVLILTVSIGSIVGTGFLIYHVVKKLKSTADRKGKFQNKAIFLIILLFFSLWITVSILFIIIYLFWFWTPP
jgi:Na+-translocating ferredoxin:NAD+ oxidoreductase RnfE subunit